jgi:hypothetical protein
MEQKVKLLVRFLVKCPTYSQGNKIKYFDRKLKAIGSIIVLVYNVKIPKAYFYGFPFLLFFFGTSHYCLCLSP